MKLRLLPLVLPMLLALAAGVAQATDLTYKLFELPPVGDDGGTVTQVNDLGHGIVQTAGEDGITGYNFWSQETGYLHLVYDDDMIRVTGMNDHDQVIGTTDDGQGAIWSPRGLVTFAAPAGYRSVFPRGIDNEGRVVGEVLDSSRSEWFAFHRSPAGEFVVDRPDTPSCVVASNDKHGAVIVAGACDCDRPHGMRYVRDHDSTMIAAHRQQARCVYGMDDEGEVLIRMDSDQENSPGLWSQANGYVHIKTPNSRFCCDLAGVADGGVVAGRVEVAKNIQTFLWRRGQGTVLVKTLLDPAKDLETLNAIAISRHGVLGGDDFWNPVILVPSQWD